MYGAAERQSKCLSVVKISSYFKVWRAEFGFRRPTFATSLSPTSSPNRHSYINIHHYDNLHLVSHYSHFAYNKHLTTMALFPDSAVEQRREALKHHDDYNAAVVARLAFLAEHPEHPPVAKPKPTPIPMSRISEDAALAVIDMQEDFCPPVCASNYLYPSSRP
jgi:hypothetical protein